LGASGAACYNRAMKLVIFDCDGVLVESEALLNRYEVEAVRRLGHSIGHEEYKDVALGRHAAHVTEQLKELYGIELPPDFWPHMARYSAEQFPKELTAVEGVAQQIQNLRVPSCVASGSTMDRLRLMLGVTELLSHFHGRIFSTQQLAAGWIALIDAQIAAKTIMPRLCDSAARLLST
jgi:beta-phosphoglucomutase-like phosphatase (HAD superfamily)